ncbi:DUF4340 domain-containing protein [Paenibacillus sp. TAB 01]|uniref:DUF4340 domain-containing protein n=1 Tax=Paenibacillus sp. TAB 01 TaxID=3368988 RepID=UPI0037534A66
MKRLIPTLLLVIICIGGFWYASSKDFFKEKTPEAAPVAKVKNEEVASYSVLSDGSELELQQKDGKWTMSKPSPLPLNDYSVTSWLDSFNMIAKDKIIDPEGKDLAKFGLDKPKQKFTVKLTNGTEQTLSVGNAVPVQGYDYALFTGSPEVFRISDSTVKSLAKTEMDFMEKSPVKFDYEQIRGLSVDWKGHKWSLTKTDVDKKSYEANWKLGDQEVKGADSSKYLDKLQSLATEQPVKKTADVKLDAPELRIELKTADTSGKEATTAYVGKLDGEQVWIAQEGGEWAFAVPASAIQELSDLDKPQPADTAAPAAPASPTAPADGQTAPAPAAK